MTSQFPVVRQSVVSRLKKIGPYNATTFLSVATNVNAATQFVFQNISDYFVNGFADLDNPPVQAVVNSDGMMGYHGLPQMPCFMYKAIYDELSPVGNTDELVNRYCSLSARIWYQRNTVGTHGSESGAEDYKAFDFLESVFARTYSLEGCEVQTITDPPS